MIIILIIPLFTLGSIYSTNASGAEQMPETNNFTKAKESQLAGGKLTGYKRGRGFELGTTVNISS